MNVLIALLGVLVLNSGDVTAFVSNEKATGSRLVSVTMGVVPAGAVVGGSVGGHRTYVANCQFGTSYWHPCQYIPQLKKAILSTSGRTQVITGSRVHVLTNNGAGGKFEWVPFGGSDFPSNVYKLQHAGGATPMGLAQRSDSRVTGDRLIAAVELSGRWKFASYFTDLNDHSDRIRGSGRTYDVLVYVSTTTTARPTTIPTIKTTAKPTTIPTIKTTAKPTTIPTIKTIGRPTTISTSHAKTTTDGFVAVISIGSIIVLFVFLILIVVVWRKNSSNKMQETSPLME